MNEFIKEKSSLLDLEDVKKQMKKTEYGYKYNLYGIDVLITSDDLNDELILYANRFVDFYRNNIEKINDHIYEKFERDNWYINDYSKEEIFNKIGKPTLYVDNIDLASICFLKNTLDEHLITVEVYKEFLLLGVTVDG